MLVVRAGTGDVGGGEGDGGLGCEEEEGGEFHGGMGWGGVSCLFGGRRNGNVYFVEAWIFGLLLVLCEELLGMLFMCGFDVVKWIWDAWLRTVYLSLFRPRFNLSDVFCMS